METGLCMKSVQDIGIALHVMQQLLIKNHRKTSEPSKTVGQPTKLLSALQADKFAKKLANDTNFGSNFARMGESAMDFTNRLVEELQRDEGKVANYMPYLTKLGFK